jgi:hypothetical protein
LSPQFPNTERTNIFTVEAFPKKKKERKKRKMRNENEKKALYQWCCSGVQPI